MKRADVLGLLLVTALGFVLRWRFALHLPYHIDEPASVLAFQQVAHRGTPVLPSGMLYLQGAVLSYLSAPLASLGLDTPAHPGWVRLVPMLAGTLAIPAAWGLTRRLGPLFAVAAALAVAIDPVGVQWGAHLRPYSLLQLLTLLLVWRATELLDKPGDDRFLLPVLFVLGAFTHVLVVTLLPGLLLAALWVHGRRLFTERRDLLWTGAACGIGPLAVVVLNRLAAASSASDQDAAGTVAFVGNHLVDPARLLAPKLYAWGNLLHRYGWAELYLAVLALPIGVLAVHRLRGQVERTDPRVIAALLAAVGIALIAFGSTTDEPRYTLHLHTLVLVASVTSLPRLWPSLGALTAGLLLVGQILGLRTTWDTAPTSVDYRPLHAHLATLHVRGEPIVTPMPATTAWFLPDRRDDIVFLAGAEDSPRPQRYTRVDAGGVPRDFWLGVPSIVSRDSWCTFIEENPRAWILWDQRRANTPAVWAGQMQQQLRTLQIRARSRDRTRLSRIDERTRLACRSGPDGDGG